jgi:hypothetical protein
MPAAPAVSAPAALVTPQAPAVAVTATKAVKLPVKPLVRRVKKAARRLADLGVGEPGSGESGLTAHAVPGTDHDSLLHSAAGVTAVVEAVGDVLARTARTAS